jgi:lysophospholipase L1-like esterase
MRLTWNRLVSAPSPGVRLGLVLLGLFVSAGCTSSVPTAAHTAVTPVLRANNAPWLKRHEGFGEIARATPRCEVLFLGDSITDHWRSKGREIWDREYAPYGAVNFGISGDRTQHLLWRLQNGGIGALRPKVVVMMIGTNNVGFESDKQRIRNTPVQIAEGIAANVKYLRQQLPGAKILLLAVFPRGDPDSPARAGVNEVNRRIARLHDGRRIFFLDIGGAFIGADGTLSPDVMPDKLHPAPKGYELWAEAMRPTLVKLLK